MMKKSVTTSVFGAVLVAGFVAIGIRNTGTACTPGVANPVLMMMPSPVDDSRPAAKAAATSATVDQLIAANPALAAVPRALLQERLAHPVHTNPPRLGAEALQALAQSGYADGGAAIQPTVRVRTGDATAAAYDAAAVKRYFASNRARYWDAKYPGAGTILRVEFATVGQLNVLHSMIGSVRPDDALICYVELGGSAPRDDHSLPPYPGETPVAPKIWAVAVPTAQRASIPSATYVFDAQTGNELLTY